MKSLMLVLLLLGVVGCSSNAVPTSTNTPSPTSTATPPTPIPSFTAIATSPPAPDSLETFPLKQDAQWVYREQSYVPGATEAGKQLTAALAITDTVVETQSHDASFAAKVVRDTTILAASIPLDQLTDDAKMLLLGDQPDTKWYVVIGDRIYWTYDPLDWTATDQFMLAYKFPLADGACWSTEPNSSETCQASDYPLSPVSRIVERLDAQHTAAGDFENCFKVSELYNSGPTIERFCPGVGIVGEDFDHSGTKFGYHSQLIQFTPGQ